MIKCYSSYQQIKLKEGSKKLHLFKNQLNVFLSRKGTDFWAPSGLIVSVHFWLLLHYIASKHECPRLRWGLFFPVSHCISEKSPSAVAILFQLYHIAILRRAAHNFKNKIKQWFLPSETGFDDSCENMVDEEGWWERGSISSLKSCSPLQWQSTQRKPQFPRPRGCADLTPSSEVSLQRF